MVSVDAATLQKLQDDIGGEAEVMRDLVDTFLGEAPRILATMREALAKEKRSDLHRGAHSLKSTAGTFGAGRLSKLCRELEADTEREMPPDAGPRVAAIEAEWALVRGELEKLRP